MNEFDWLPIFLHFSGLSLLAVGGAIATLPEMHRYLVNEHSYLSPEDFANSVALGQIAPGPNVLFVALMGWNIGMNAAGGPQSGYQAWFTALFGGLGCLLFVLLPSSLLTFSITRWLHQNRELAAVRSFKSGMAPIVIGLMVSTGWLLQASHLHFPEDIGLWILTLATVLVVLRTRLHLLWMLFAGAMLGLFGWV